jgi:hypothetical protein
VRAVCLRGSLPSLGEVLLSQTFSPATSCTTSPLVSVLFDRSASIAHDGTSFTAGPSPDRPRVLNGIVSAPPPTLTEHRPILPSSGAVEVYGTFDGSEG